MSYWKQDTDIRLDDTVCMYNDTLQHLQYSAINKSFAKNYELKFAVTRRQVPNANALNSFIYKLMPPIVQNEGKQKETHQMNQHWLISVP